MKYFIYYWDTVLKIWRLSANYGIRVMNAAGYDNLNEAYRAIEQFGSTPTYYIVLEDEKYPPPPS